VAFFATRLKHLHFTQICSILFLSLVCHSRVANADKRKKIGNESRFDVLKWDSYRFYQLRMCSPDPQYELKKRMRSTDPLYTGVVPTKTIYLLSNRYRNVATGGIHGAAFNDCFQCSLH
jgi:hypothetical protein